jgi:hypothetical protein
MKDPAFLFYSSDFLTGTSLLNDEQVGKYIRILCHQHQRGHLSEKDMKKICNGYDEDIFCKFQKDCDGNFFNQRLEDEINKRKNYSESRRQNRLKKEKDMNNISKSYDKHMENENENEIINVINNKNNVSKNLKPTLNEVRQYCAERNRGVDAEKFFNYYESNGWKVGKNAMKNWKAAVHTWEKNNVQPTKSKLVL